VLVTEYPAPASMVDDEISWDNLDNIYINKFYRYSPSNPTHYHKITAYDRILTPHEIVDIYNNSQPPIVSELPTLDWNFNGDLTDTVNSVEFNNPYGIDITSEFANVNTMGTFPNPTNYLFANVPVALLSSFLKTLMFRFKALDGFHPSVHFVFSTFLGNQDNDLGMMVRVVGDNVVINFHETNHSDGTKNTLHEATHVIKGAPSIFFDEFVHMVIVLDHTNNFITTYINGIRNDSTDALVSGTTQVELDQGTCWGNGSTIQFLINRWAN
jgi:hypothetical protein